VRPSTLNPKQTRKRSVLFLIASIALTLSLSQNSLAQSGRRQGKVLSPSPPPAADEPKPEPTPATPPAKPDAQAKIIVGGDKLGSSIYLSSSYVEYTVNSCIERLNDSAALEAIGGGNMSRKDAIDRAKKETASYVLLLELRLDNDDTDISISYSLFAPQTAKILTSGRVYLGTMTAGRGPVGVGVPSVTRNMPLQYQLKEGARQVADRVKGKISVRNPGLTGA